MFLSLNVGNKLKQIICQEYIMKQLPKTYNFSEQHHILSSHDEYPTGNVAKFFPYVNSLNGLVKHQIGWRGDKWMEEIG